MANVNDPRHELLIKDVSDHLTALGFNVSEHTYHGGHLSRHVVERMQTTFSPTALHVRSGPDRLAVHPADGMTFYCEAKGGSPTAKDICIEAMPLADHMHHARRGILCLYCCLDSRGFYRGFWAHDVPPIRHLYLPAQRMEKLHDWYRQTLPRYFPDVPMICLDSVNGSGDPFIVIDQTISDTLPHWRELIDAERRTWTAFGCASSLWSRSDDPITFDGWIDSKFWSNKLSKEGTQ